MPVGLVHCRRRRRRRGCQFFSDWPEDDTEEPPLGDNNLRPLVWSEDEQRNKGDPREDLRAFHVAVHECCCCCCLVLFAQIESAGDSTVSAIRWDLRDLQGRTKTTTPSEFVAAMIMRTQTQMWAPDEEGWSPAATSL